VTIVGAELLASATFEALPLADGRLLGEAVAIDNAGSLPLMLAVERNAEPVAAAQASVALFACTDPAAADGLEPVDAIRFPADDVLPALEAAYARVTPVLAELATTAAFRELEYAEHTVAHLVLHGAERLAIGAEPGLRTYDGAIDRLELSQRRWPALVIVSACGSGRGPRRAGEGDAFHSVAGACLWNGAAAVIASRRDLAARAHLQLLVACHRHLAAGCAPAVAMQRARAERAAGADPWRRVQAAQVQVFGAGHARLIAR
jgi:CHAT domain-containing protein